MTQLVTRAWIFQEDLRLRDDAVIVIISQLFVLISSIVFTLLLLARFYHDDYDYSSQGLWLCHLILHDSSMDGKVSVFLWCALKLLCCCTCRR